MANKDFTVSNAPQGSREWLDIRAPRIGASEIGTYMAKGVKGQYLAGRKEIEKKIAYAKAFGVPFQGYVNGAMQAGTDNEPFVAREYAKINDVALEQVGCAYNDWLVASPDRKIVGQNGGVEIKWLYDKEFSELVATGFPKQEHFDQMQGQMWAYGWDFVDYAAGNGNTSSLYIVRVNRNEKRIEEIKAERESVLAIEPMDTKGVYKFSEQPPVPHVTELGF